MNVNNPIKVFILTLEINHQIRITMQIVHRKVKVENNRKKTLIINDSIVKNIEGRRLLLLLRNLLLL